MRTTDPRGPKITDANRVLLAEARARLRGALLALVAGAGTLAWASGAGWR